ncbi:MAG: hypothetical protein CM1200mP15_04620 [Dehalococcoidia bacterium]|nr:MAG: hypothetical protein CM1200mP15_04620 [Dehalococcoidia bacterium]
MYMIRRVARTQPGKAWEVAGYLTKICEAYESNGKGIKPRYTSEVRDYPARPTQLLQSGSKTQLNQIGQLSSGFGTYG